MHSRNLSSLFRIEFDGPRAPARALRLRGEVLLLQIGLMLGGAWLANILTLVIKVPYQATIKYISVMIKDVDYVKALMTQKYNNK